MGRHSLGEGQTKGGRRNTRKSKRREGGRRARRNGGGGQVSSAEPTSRPDPKMERASHPTPPDLPPSRSHTRETQSSLRSQVQRRPEEEAGSRKTHPPAASATRAEAEPQHILSSTCTRVCVCVLCGCVSHILCICVKLQAIVSD